MTRALRSHMTGALRAAVAVCTALVGASSMLGAQQANSSAAAAGMNNNYVAVAQGQDAVAWNPAMLGLSRNPHFSLNLLTPSGTAGLAPVSWNDIMQYAKANDSIPSSVRKAWLASVNSRGGETGSENASINWLGLSVGHLALSVSTTQTMQTTLNPDMFQAIMFGNAGLTGSLQNLAFSGSNMHASAFTTAAAGYGFSFGNGKRGAGESSIGLTVKYVMGNFLLIGQDQGSTITGSNVNVNFPVVMTNTNDSTGSGGSGSSASNALTKGGSGYGMDIGYAWRTDRMTISVVAQNVFNSFAWDVSQLESRPGSALFNGTTSSSNFNAAAYSAAPQALQQMVKEYVFKPALMTGIAFQTNRVTTVTADIHEQFGGPSSILIGPQTQVGGGIEFRGIPILPLRAGASYVTGGWSASGGLGIALGPWEIGVAGLLGHRNGGNENGVMLSVISIK
jgi:hypothetical protein